MGKPTTPNSHLAPPPYKPYRDDPSLADAVSLHTSPEHGQDLLDLPESSGADTLAQPPPYQDDPTNSVAETPVTLSHNAHRNVVLDDCKKRSDGTYILIDYDPNPEILNWQIQQWQSWPPAQMIRIYGYHRKTTKTSDGKSETNDVTDFDIKLRLTEYFFTHPGRSVWTRLDVVENDVKTHRGTILRKKSKLARDPEALKPSLLQWCHQFCASHHQLKMYVM